MTTFYRWAMRQGSPILFAISGALFVFSFAQALLTLRDTVAHGPIPGLSIGEAGIQWLYFLTGALTALGTAVLPFLGAVIIHRWDGYQVTDTR